MRKFKELREDAIRRFGRDPYPAYLQHKSNAKHRGIPFLFEFPAWLAAWGEKFPESGTRLGKMNMCRNGDVGPYAVGNVRIASSSANGRERCQVIRRQKVKEDWTFDGVDRSSCADWLDERRDMGYL